MNSAEFSAYKTRLRTAIRNELATAERGRLDEAAFPAYSHRNPLINWLFWQRLRSAMNHIDQLAPFARVLDFGCGSGVMLPFLAQRSQHVIAMDTDLEPLERVRKHIPLAPNVEIVDAKQTLLADLPASAFDLIVALDVLEHVHDLPQTVLGLIARLKPGGQLLVSGPTENLLYQIGRRLAGPEYSGEYHERGIADIKRELAKSTNITQIASLYPPFPLFEVFSART